MLITDPVEFADRKSRRRPIATALAAAYFLGIQWLVHPSFGAAGPRNREYGWAANAAVLLLLLLPGVGFIWGSRIRQLINDDVARAHARTATVAAFWLTMVLALGLFLLPASAAWTARQAVYLLVTPAVAGALLLFSWLEWRAHRDG